MDNVIAAVLAVVIFYVVQAFVAYNDNFENGEMVSLSCPVKDCK